jgi:hypothetical protein
MKNTQKGARRKSLGHYYPISRVFSEYFCSGMSHPESTSVEDNGQPKNNLYRRSRHLTAIRRHQPQQMLPLPGLQIRHQQV